MMYVRPTAVDLGRTSATAHKALRSGRCRMKMYLLVACLLASVFAMLVWVTGHLVPFGSSLVPCSSRACLPADSAYTYAIAHIVGLTRLSPRLTHSTRLTRLALCLTHSNVKQIESRHTAHCVPSSHHQETPRRMMGLTVRTEESGEKTNSEQRS